MAVLMAIIPIATLGLKDRNIGHIRTMPLNFIELK
jgi:hypothetical protein